MRWVLGLKLREIHEKTGLSENYLSLLIIRATQFIKGELEQTRRVALIKPANSTKNQQSIKETLPKKKKKSPTRLKITNASSEGTGTDGISQKKILAWISSLPDLHKRIIGNRYLKRQSYTQIAKAEGLSTYIIRREEDKAFAKFEPLKPVEIIEPGKLPSKLAVLSAILSGKTENTEEQQKIRKAFRLLEPTQKQLFQLLLDEKGNYSLSEIAIQLNLTHAYAEQALSEGIKYLESMISGRRLACLAEKTYPLKKSY